MIFQDLERKVAQIERSEQDRIRQQQMMGQCKTVSKVIINRSEPVPLSRSNLILFLCT